MRGVCVGGVGVQAHDSMLIALTKSLRQHAYSTNFTSKKSVGVCGGGGGVYAGARQPHGSSASSLCARPQTSLGEPQMFISQRWLRASSCLLNQPATDAYSWMLSSADIWQQV